MSKSPASEVTGTTPADLVLAAAGTAKDLISCGQVDLLIAAADWADLHRAADGEVESGHLMLDKRLFLAGAGAPGVEEFASYELAATLGWTTEATQALLADALELRHRLPRLWDLTVAGTVPVSIARDIASETTELSFEAAADADRLICADPRHVGRVAARRLVEEIRLWHDPDRARAVEENALAERGVWVHDTGSPAAAELRLVLEREDAAKFDSAVAAVAGSLKQLGDTDDLDVRRAKAVGVLADPQLALDLLDGDPVNARGDALGRVERRNDGGRVELFVHLSDRSLLARDGRAGGPVSIERLGTVTQDLIRDWLSGAQVTIRPVLDPQRIAPVDRHDPPETMRHAVILRDSQCVFPGCTRDSRRADLDHIAPYVDPDEGGPPGQTRMANLAPLCRRHHRAKTHGDFDYQRLPDGSYRWRLPTGRECIVVPDSRTPA